MFSLRFRWFQNNGTCVCSANICFIYEFANILIDQELTPRISILFMSLMWLQYVIHMTANMSNYLTREVFHAIYMVSICRLFDESNMSSHMTLYVNHLTPIFTLICQFFDTHICSYIVCVNLCSFIWRRLLTIQKYYYSLLVLTINRQPCNGIQPPKHNHYNDNIMIMKIHSIPYLM